MIRLFLIEGKTLDVVVDDIRKVIPGEGNQSLVWIKDNQEPIVVNNPFPTLMEIIHGVVTINHQVAPTIIHQVSL